MKEFTRRSMLFRGATVSAAISMQSTETSLAAPASVTNRYDDFPVLTAGNYPGLDVSGQHSSSSQILAALRDAEGNRLLIPKGRFIFDDPNGMTIREPTQITGAGMRFASEIIFVGTGRRIKRTYRASPADEPDATMSAAVSIEAAGVSMQDIYLQCQFDAKSNDWGADWDCGIFVKSVPYFTARSIRTDGYWRQAGLYYDVTANNGGCDQSSLVSCRFKGFWGMRIAGPDRPPDEKPSQQRDVRGAGGMSSFYGQQLVLEGNTRSPDRVRYSNDDGGGLSMSGWIANPFGRLNNFEFQQTRISTAEPFLYRLDAIAGVTFRKLHGERVTGVKDDQNMPIGNDRVKALVTKNAVNIAFDDASHANVSTEWNEPSVVRALNCIDLTSAGVTKSVSFIKN